MDKPVNKTKKSHKPYFSHKYKQRKQGGAIAPYALPPTAYATDNNVNKTDSRSSV